MTKHLTSKSAFSLVEVSIALAVVSFCMATLMALLPIGVTLSHNAVRRTVAAGLASGITSDLRSAPGSNASATVSKSPQYKLSIPVTGNVSAVQTLYFAQNGSLTGSVGSAPTQGSAYRVTLVFTPPTANQVGPTTVRILVSWPALADPIPTSLPAHFQGSMEFVTALDRN